MGDLNTLSAEAMDSMELTEMDRIFRSLLKKGYLEDMEFQKLICIKKVADRKSEVYDIMMKKDQTTADEIFNILRRMTSRVHAKENNGNHALLSAVVADCIFGFLPTNDILNCRLVCQQWKTASSNTLRKRVTIKFEKGLGPSKFFKVFKKSLADIRFKSFNFGKNYEYGWDVSEMEEFFDKWGANIEALKLKARCLFKKTRDNWLKSYDITHWISKACNLTKLNVDSPSAQDQTKIELQISEVSSVKFISLCRCIISIDDALKANIQIKPVEITLHYVTFQREGIIQKNFRLNDVINFSQATQITLRSEPKFELDMMSQILNVKSFIDFTNLKLTNLSAASGKVNYLSLCRSNFVEKNRLQISQLFCENGTVDFSALPKSIKKLFFSDRMRYICREEIDLPQLRFLRFDNSEDYPQISHFNRCSNLVELDLQGGSWYRETVNVNVNLIPQSVKRIKLDTNIFLTDLNADDNVGQEIRGENSILNLDTLILEDYLHCLSSEVSEMMSIVKPRVLVVSCCDHERVIDTTSICEFLLTNKQLDKLIVGSTIHDLHHKIPFEVSVFARFVGRKKSDYYEFESHHETISDDEDPTGKPISKEEFDLYRQMNELNWR